MAKKGDSKKKEKKKEGVLKEYNFPAYQVTVKAKDIAEANEKLKKLLNLET